jgi:hypothetical protein
VLSVDAIEQLLAKKRDNKQSKESIDDNIVDTPIVENDDNWRDCGCWDSIPIGLLRDGSVPDLRLPPPLNAEQGD